MLADLRLETPLGGNVNPPSQEPLQVQHQGRVIEQAPSPLQLHQEIDIALRVRLPSGYGAKDPDVRGAMPGRDPQDLLPFLLQDFSDLHSSPPLPVVGILPFLREEYRFWTRRPTSTLQFNEMPPTVFISYSHKDEVWKDRLLPHLAALKQQGQLAVWDDRKIRGGDEWSAEIWKAIDAAHVAILLVSANSLASEFILEKEVPYLMDRRKRDGLSIFPVLCADCLWGAFRWLADLQMFPRDGKALAAFRGNSLQTELKKIAQEILNIVQNGSQPVAPLKPAATITSTLPSLHQLPAPPADFTGREEDLQALRSALTQGGTGAIFGLRGLGGVGKTTLALKLAEELTPRYPDAQLYLDLKGVAPQPLTAEQAMAHVIRSFHPDAQLPEDGTALAGLYRSVLFGKRTLLLMDNASKQGREQVEPLIPPAGSLLLVTSRFHFTLPGLVARDLDEMSKEDARDLLLKMAPRIGNGADEIARLCGWLPLALRLAGSVLVERKDLSPSEYARRLQEGKEQLDPVDASLNLSYGLLNSEQQRLWRMLTVFPGTFDIEAAAAVWELEIDPAKEGLWDLVRCSLVEWEEKKERYRLHDLARQSAGRRIEAFEQDAAQRRYARYYLRVLGDTNRLYLRGGQETLLALRLFDTEWGNIRAGYTWAASRFLKDDEAAEVCDSYPRLGESILELRQLPRERISWIESALAASRQRQDLSAEVSHIGNLAIAYRHLGKPRHTIELCKQSLEIARKIGDRYGEGKALHTLGLANTDIGELPLAITIYEQSLAIACDIGDQRGKGNILNSIGVAYLELDKPRRSIRFFRQRLTIARDIGDKRGESHALGNLGLAKAALGGPRRAIEHYSQVLAITRHTGDRRIESQAIGCLGRAYAKLGERHRAVKCLEQWRAMSHEMEDRRSEAIASWDLGVEVEKEGDLFRAADLMQIRVDFEREIGHRDAEKHAAQLQHLHDRIAAQS